VARPSSDDPLDRLLTRALSSRASAAGVCPEPELLAAFVDGSLDRADREQVERHAASCSRCANILAATVASTPASELPAQGTLWSGWRAWRWAVPVATAVTVAGVWFASTRPRDLPVPAAAVEEAQAPSPAPPAVTQAPASPPVESKPESALSASRRAYADKTTLAKKERDGTEREAVAPPATAAPEARADSQERAAESTQTLADAAPKQPVTAERAIPPPARSALPQTASGAANATAVARARAEETMLFVRAPDATVQWRTNRGNVIERSTDRGTTWTVEHTASQPIAGGASSSADVAWFFSRDGLVVRRTPGGWVETRAPAGVQIVSLDATSATQATVRAADGRTFETRDGGATWNQR
jgi:putative zinc finger protein